ncbi:LysR family transcriptional regulator [Pseudomonas mosselii]|uniref:LysR family transcriptional regulator n=1 Tax=Pseudomonas mosselii TaxID=78327 RepID=A0ABX9B7X9_9PSED|nr:LysR family transcriptional regulator [Pseudomonas mosselii]MBC3459088.1 LysR family transcriptional regulator [Pseudomonas mosselii]MBH3310092.1 LysR family transcriptional regulator [Pseudomonas mosselii]MBH3326758.1 LysR family transcriptional regulator [Pseudomonas mosselii]MCH7420122.1 LysR family transcriptional regulator [Pseudomonas mosselii]MCL8301758.1 LysR family transcriptional regulator [Pseudomonas mosselii]
MLDQLALFLTIIEKGSLSAAGRDRGLSPATVSERLSALEAHYGVTLLTRSTRSLSLTDAGRLLADGARRLLAEAEELQSQLQDGQQKISGLVRLSAPVDLGQHCIVPLLDRFLAEHPDVSIDLDLTDGYVDLVGQGIDLAIRYGTLADSSLRARPLGDNRRVVCAAPDYLRRHGIPLHPDDLARHDCIVMRFGIHTERVWPFRLGAAAYPVSVRGRRVANNGEQVRRWALAGHGLCLKSLRDVQDDLDEGRLVEVLGDFSAGPVALQIVYPPTRVQPRRVRALMEAIVAQLG